jgi:UDP-glucuronate 4-epimerase
VTEASVDGARRAVVTGAAGFIGSTLVDRLLRDGWTVLGIDAFDPYYPRARKLRNLSGAMANPRFTLREADTRDLPGLLAAVGPFEPEAFFDLAARGGVRPSIVDPQGYIDINVRGLQNTLTAAAEHGARIVFASSSSVYGNDPERPFREDQARGRPLSPYGATKVAGEALVQAHHAVSGLPVGIARLFTVFGPRQRPDLAVMTFANRILDGEPIELFDGGRGVRDFTFVDDTVDALVRLGASEHPALTVNVGSGRPLPTLQVVDELERALGREARRQVMPAQPGDVMATHADIELARRELGWEPLTPFADGIDRFCAWLQADRRDQASAVPADVAAE